MPITAGQWDELCVAIGRSDLIVDERFAGLEERRENADALHDIFTAWTSERTKHDVMQILGDAGVPCSACLDTEELHSDPRLVERGFIHQIDHPGHGEVPLLGFAPRLSESEVEIERAPLLGEHTDDVLAEELGLETKEITALRQSGIVA